jgi:uncharacterized protein
LNLSDPLSDDELEELETFLVSGAVGEEGMDISMLDGFLTALAVGPNTLSPSQWLPAVWGRQEVAWGDKRQAERIMSLIFRHANAILFYLRDEPDTFEPLLYEREAEGQAIPIIDEWCAGFVAGMALDEAGWQELLDSAEGDELLYPILLYGTETGWEEMEKHPELEERHEALAASLGDCVMGIHAWWLPKRKARSTMRRDEPKVGRNDLCPCGSGRKFKRCCGAPDKLH